METITTIRTAKGPLYLTKREKSKLAAYSKRLEEYEKQLFRKYGKEYMLRITPTEYKAALRLHNEVFKLTQKIKRGQKTMKKRIKR
jgi:hypothetical protein